MLIQKEISREQLSQLADEGDLYAVIDACGCHEPVMSKAYQELSSSSAVCLFKGTYMESYDAVAPYLFSVDMALLEWIGKALDPQSWGIFIVTKATVAELSAHLQRFFLAALPDRRKWFFRYYDPRILRGYLHTCNDAELRQFFGPIGGFAISEWSQQKALLFAQSGSSTQGPEPGCFHPNGLWLIRQEQFNALGNLSKEHFIQQAAAHLEENFPELCSLLNRQELLDYVQYGIQRAASYGITLERQVCQYIDFMCAFGLNFDRDPGHLWASKILNDGAIQPPSEKLERLYAALAPLGATHGG